MGRSMIGKSRMGRSRERGGVEWGWLLVGVGRRREWRGTEETIGRKR